MTRKQKKELKKKVIKSKSWRGKKLYTKYIRIYGDRIQYIHRHRPNIETTYLLLYIENIV